MTVASEPEEITVTASTRHSSAGADWFPRRHINTGRVCWFYGPRLRPGVEKASNWCSADPVHHLPYALIPIEEISDDLSGGIPCPQCDSKWSLTGSS